MKKYEGIIIHCSDSDNSRYDFERIRQDHTIHRGWSAIGYHAGITHDARTVFLRDVNRDGAHTAGHNHYFGICLLGKSYFSSDQFVALASLCSFLMKVYGLTADDIYPHNAFNEHKTCPNFDLEEWKICYLEAELCRWK